MACSEQLRDGVDVSSIPQHSSDQSVSEEDLKQERDHFLRIANAFLYYKYVYLLTTASRALVDVYSCS